MKVPRSSSFRLGHVSMMIRIVILKDGGGDQVLSVIVLLLLSAKTIESNWVLMLSIAIGKITPNVQVV